MKVRRPDFDFSNSPAHWAANPEFAQSINASSVWLPYLERFLNRVMAKVSGQLDPADPRTSALKDDIKTFIRQESMHYANHGAFNQVLVREGYEIEEFQSFFEAEYERLFSSKSLAFLCAYCAGFETLGPPGARMWLGGIEKQLQGADPAVVQLWKWHLMEEFEHRNVCHDVFQAFSGNYFMRIYGLVYQVWHVGGFTQRVLKYLHEKDRAKMTPDEIKASKRRAKSAGRAMMTALGLAILRSMLPFYSPRNAKVPLQYQQIIKEYDRYAA